MKSKNKNRKIIGNTDGTGIIAILLILGGLLLFSAIFGGIINDKELEFQL